MSIGREIEDIARDLIKHQHDHPPVRDLNREVERKLTFADRVAADFARLVGSWIFVLAQVGIMVLWVGLNAFTSSQETGYFYSLPSNRLELWAYL